MVIESRMSAAKGAFWPIVVLLVVLGLATGCGESRRSEDRLVLVFTSDPSSLDPAFAKDVYSGTLVNYIFSTLVRFNKDTQLEGDLSDTFALGPDRRTYTFHLRPNARFASGRPVTPSDVKYSFERLLDPKTASPRSWVLDRLEGAREFMAGKVSYVSGIRVKGACVTLTLSEPFAPFLGLLSMPAASVVDPDAVRRWGKEFPRHDSGSGPFTVLSWVRDSGIDLAPNPTHHGGVPKIKGIVVRVLKEPVTIVTEFKRGNVDIAEVPSSEFTSLTSEPKWAGCVQDMPGLNIYYLGLNCEKGPFKDLRLRRAAAMAIDRDRIISTVRKGQVVAAMGPIPPGLLGYESGFPGIRYDPEQAKALVREAGGAPTSVIRLVQGEDKANLEVTQMVQAYLQAVGFRVKVQPYEGAIFKKRVDEGDFGLFFYSWYADYPDAENFLFPLFHSSRKGGAGNGPRYSDPAIDALLTQAQGTTDDKARRELYRQIEDKVVADASRVFLFNKKTVYIRQPWVKGFQVYRMFNGDRLLDVFMDQGQLGVW